MTSITTRRPDAGMGAAVAPPRDDGFPTAGAAVPSSTTSAGRYLMRFARTADELDRILRLRSQVFNVELEEGPESAHATGRDEDEFDRRFHHLLIEDRESSAIVGTYRMQTAEMAAAGGYYSADLFQVEMLPEPVLRKAVEVGRACVAKPHRTDRVLNLLWRGLANYLAWNDKSVLFGCCSLISQDEKKGLAVHKHLVRSGGLHLDLHVLPRPEKRCATADRIPAVGPHVPALFQAYLDLGAKILGPPAIDRQFKTIDWLVLLDVNQLDRPTFRSFFR